MESMVVHRTPERVMLALVQLASNTGTKTPDNLRVASAVDRIKGHTNLPVVVGFGISKPEHLAALQGQADGVIVASALLDAIAQAPDDPVAQVRRFLTQMRVKPAP